MAALSVNKAVKKMTKDTKAWQGLRYVREELKLLKLGKDPTKKATFCLNVSSETAAIKDWYYMPWMAKAKLEGRTEYAVIAHCRKPPTWHRAI